MCFIEIKRFMSNHATKMLEKLYIQCIVNRVNKATLIEEAKVHRIKNYTRISKEDLCIQLWNHEEYVNTSNIKRIITCNKKRSKKEDVSQKNEGKSKVKTSKTVTFDDSVKNDFSAPCAKENIKVKGPKKVKKSKIEEHAYSIHDECANLHEKPLVKEDIEEEEEKKKNILFMMNVLTYMQ